jgi:hypothetical protein
MQPGLVGEGSPDESKTPPCTSILGLIAREWPPAALAEFACALSALGVGGGRGGAPDGFSRAALWLAAGEVYDARFGFPFAAGGDVDRHHEIAQQGRRLR